MATNEVATLGGGCFWCLEAVYDRMEGVVSVESGYMGGQVANPSYQDVCSGTTGHVEVTRVTFDPSAVTFREILEVFFSVHDPTTLNRQGNDVGTQYRSVIFYHGEEQKATAQAMIGELTAEHVFRDPIVTALEPAATFYVAEDYHQEYFQNHPNQPYCAFVVAPKVKKFREKFADKMKA
ncbi:MAG TPA: peptide-methionine (S)-S-oxide reductase MsrA [Verrucomicrobiae bacterium]|nr:peptide-methionine (S)-S-oxide reductase MsrA [Verrucomicrobiae bacterium]